MALDPTARESNYLDSMKKYLVDNLATTEGLNLSFDRTLATPSLRNKSIDKWVMVNPGALHRDDMSTAHMDIYCCVRKDNEGFKLAQLTDTVMGYLTVSTGADSTRRITFYQSSPTVTWTVIGGIIVQEVYESARMLSEDGTKYKILSVILRFASKV